MADLFFMHFWKVLYNGKFLTSNFEKTIHLHKSVWIINEAPYVTESAKTGLIYHDRKFDFITQTQSLMNDSTIKYHGHRQLE